MHMTRGWTWTRTAVAALALAVAAAAPAAADEIDSTKAGAANTVTSLLNYSTSGAIDLSGVTGANVISFNSVSDNQFTAPSSFSLGEFLVAPLPVGVSTSYNNTPFSVTYIPRSVDGKPLDFDPGSVLPTISGFLTGTVTGPSQIDVVATFKPVDKPAFQTGDFINTLSVLDAAVSLVPSTTNGGRTTAQGRIEIRAAPVPEPASVAVFLAALVGGLGLRRRVLARAS